MSQLRLYEQRWCGPVVTTSTLAASMNGSDIGTYGVYSVGIAGQIVNTGWLGYARFDYESGSEIKGWTASGGLRYQFTPEPPPPAFAKAPVPIVKPVLWTGFYIGGFGGVTTGGKTDINLRPRPCLTALYASIPGRDLRSATCRRARRRRPWLQLPNGQMGAGPGRRYRLDQYPRIEGVRDVYAHPALPTNALFNVTCHDKLKLARDGDGRIGYAWDRALYYVKAGGAWTHEDFSVTCNLGAINVAGSVPQSCFSPRPVRSSTSSRPAPIASAGPRASASSSRSPTIGRQRLKPITSTFGKHDYTAPMAPPSAPSCTFGKPKSA